MRRGADGAIPACVLRGVREPTAPPAQRPLRSRLIKVILFKPRRPFGDAGVAHLHLNAGRVAAAAATEQALMREKETRFHLLGTGCIHPSVHPSVRPSIPAGSFPAAGCEGGAVLRADEAGDPQRHPGALGGRILLPRALLCFALGVHSEGSEGAAPPGAAPQPFPSRLLSACRLRQRRLSSSGSLGAEGCRESNVRCKRFQAGLWLLRQTGLRCAAGGGTPLASA